MNELNDTFEQVLSFFFIPLSLSLSRFPLTCPLFRRRRQSSLLSRFHDLLKKLNRRGERASKFAICTKCEPVSLKRHRDRVESSISSPLAFRLIFCSANASLCLFLSLSIYLSICIYIYIYICPIPSLIIATHRFADWFLRPNFYIAGGRDEASFDFNKINYKLPTETSRSPDGRHF